MRKFNAENGLVSIIASNINDMQEAVNANIYNRLQTILRTAGLKGSEEENFEIDWKHLYSGVGINRFEITCKNLGTVVFGDYMIIPSPNSDLSVELDFGTATNTFVYLTRSKLYTNDQSDNFKPGHPVDEDGNPPASGYNVESQDVLELHATTSDNLVLEEVIPLVRLERDGAELTISEDLRGNHVLTLKDFGFYASCDDQVEDLAISTVHHLDLLETTHQTDGSVNVFSPVTNLSVNRAYFKLEWTELKDVFAYEVRLIAIDGDGNQVGHPRYEIFPALQPESHAVAHYPVTEGVKYRIAIRVLSDAPNHAPGPWYETEKIAGLSQVQEAREIIPAPTLEVRQIQGGEGEEFAPVLIGVRVVPDDATPSPYYVQIFESDMEPSQQIVSSQFGDLIYEGAPKMLRRALSESDAKYYAGRVVGPGGICSDTVAHSEGFNAPAYGYPEYMPQEMVMVIPIASITDKNTAYPLQLCSFFPPEPGLRLKSAAFNGTGTMIATSEYLNPDPAEFVVAQLAFGDEDASFKEHTAGVEALFDEVVKWSTADSEFPEGQKMYVTQYGADFEHPDDIEDYYAIDVHREYANAPVWSPDKRIFVWACLYDWTGADFYMNYAGTLVLVFERTEGIGVSST